MTCESRNSESNALIFHEHENNGPIEQKTKAREI